MKLTIMLLLRMATPLLMMMSNDVFDVNIVGDDADLDHDDPGVDAGMGDDYVVEDDDFDFDMNGVDG